MLGSAHDVVCMALWYQVAIKEIFSQKWLGRIDDLERLKQLEFT
jgi:hypothetical protein